MAFGSEGTGSVSDRLHWRYSVVVYVVLAIAHIGLKWLHYGQGLPRCNCPAHTTDSFRSYVEAECAVKQYLPESRVTEVPITSLQREEPREVYLGYSSWVAAIFLLQAFLFCSTQPVWHFLSVRLSGINVKSLVSNLAMSEEGGHPQPKRDVISDAASSLKIFFDRTLRMRHESYWVPFFHGNMLTLSYIVAKCLCLLNAVVQFYLIGALLQVNYPRYGFQALSRWTSMPGNITTDVMQALFPGIDTDVILHDVRNSDDPNATKHLEELGIDKEMASSIEALFVLHPESDTRDIPQIIRNALRDHPILQIWNGEREVRFPTQFYCDVKLRQLGNQHRYTVQCSLPALTLLEPFFLFDWFWMCVVAMITVCSLICLGCNVASLSCHTSGMVSMLRVSQCPLSGGNAETHGNTDKDRVACFLERYLHRDGVVLLQMISSATNKMVAEELTRRLWDEVDNNWTEYEPLLALPGQTKRYVKFPDERYAGQPTTEVPQDFRMEELSSPLEKSC